MSAAVDRGIRRWTEPVGRAGLVARGFIYCVAAIAAVAVAFGRRGEHVDRRGALELLARQSYGSVLLVLLAAGFAGYALWRGIRAATGAREGGKPRDGARGYVRRLADVGAAAVYVTLLAATVKILTRHSASDGGDQQAKTWSARLLAHQGGRVLVVLVGVGFVATGTYLAYRGARKKFEKHLRVSEMHGWQRRWLPWLGTAGYTARGVIAGLVGLFLVQAAASYDADKATGVDGALHRLGDSRFGPAALALVAVGLVAFGLFSFVEARWRKVLEG